MEILRDIDIAKRAYGQALRKFRLKTKPRLSQEKLGLAAGVNRSHMFKLESGLTNPTLYTMLRICEVLNVPFRRFAAELENYLASMQK